MTPSPADPTQHPAPPPPFRLGAGGGVLGCTVAAYGLYATFVLIEVLDFLAELHSPEPGYSPMYDLTNVAFFIVEMVICAVFAFVFL